LKKDAGERPSHAAVWYAEQLKDPKLQAEDWACFPGCKSTCQVQCRSLSWLHRQRPVERWIPPTSLSRSASVPEEAEESFERCADILGGERTQAAPRPNTVVHLQQRQVRSAPARHTLEHHRARVRNNEGSRSAESDGSQVQRMVGSSKRSCWGGRQKIEARSKTERCWHFTNSERI